MFKFKKAVETGCTLSWWNPEFCGLGVSFAGVPGLSWTLETSVLVVMRSIRKYLASLLDPEFIPTGLRTAALVGSLLFLINHGPALMRGDMTHERWMSTALTYLMPYLVSVYGQHSYRSKLTKGTPLPK
jgi:hypothetical protein